MDKQILADGADFEASTGYHNFVTQMLLYTFLLAKRNDVEIDERYWQRLRSMLDYIRGILRPDGRTPLIGDADGSQIVPVVKRNSDDAAYLLGIAAVAFDEAEFKEFSEPTPEMLWLFGEDAVDIFNAMPEREDSAGSVLFPDAGTCMLRDGDLYLHLNVNDTGTNGRGSHAHNDALSIEVSAFKRAFIVDPGSYVYNLDRDARHRFRSTAYHSTLMVDGEEQNTTQTQLPFVLGNEAKPKIVEWRTTAERDDVVAEHYGYVRLAEPAIHRRTIKFDRIARCWTITDNLSGKGTHEILFSFHLAPGISVDTINEAIRLSDVEGNGLLISTNCADEFEIIAAGASRTYGHIEESSILRWPVKIMMPVSIRTILLPAARGENLNAKLELLARLADNSDN
jgi:hypothetical protein